jgi:PAS domain S-box-containing protein
MELYDRIAELSQRYEPFHIDEMIWVILFLILAFANFSWHRYKELNDEVEERKKAEKLLRESEEKYSAVVEHSKDAVVIVKDGVLKFVNNVSLDFMGAIPGDMVGTKFNKWVAPESRDIVKKRLKGTKIDDDELNIYEIIIKRKDGSKVPAEVNSTFIEYEDGPADLIAIRDITERKRLEAQVRKYTTNLESIVEEKTKEVEDSYHRLQKVDKMRTELIDVAAHELRTPLTSIKAYINLMETGHVGQFDDNEKPTLKDMTNNINNLNALINDMLDYTRTEGKLLELSLIKSSLTELVEEVVNNFKTIANTQNISLILTPSLDIDVPMDREMMKKVLVNLIGNAIKYSSEGGRVTISIRDGKKQVVVSVKDTGIGIKKDELPYVFERFYMGDTSLTREKDQMGFGLSIARSIIEKHFGKIWVESEHGKGSTFYFSILK